MSSITWNSILLQKAEEPKTLPLPYVHPLVKRSRTTLSVQSLEICTESLGSETGSDGFEAAVMESEDGFEQTQRERIPYQLAARRTRPRSFPPPIQFLSQENRGRWSLSMHSRRDKGRLVLEAVSVPSEKNFVAQREEGRLVLWFASDDPTLCKDEEETYEEGEDDLVMEMEEDICVDDDEEEIVTTEFTTESIREALSSGEAINLQMLTMMLNKPAALLNGNSAWERKCNKRQGEEEFSTLLERLLSEEQTAPLTVTASASLNTYDYFWRKKLPAMTPIVTAHTGNNNVNEERESRLPTRDGCLAPSLHGCISPSGTNLPWKTKCITTS